jgi:hypothetical protein
VRKPTVSSPIVDRMTKRLVIGMGSATVPASYRFLTVYRAIR